MTFGAMTALIEAHSRQSVWQCEADEAQEMAPRDRLWQQAKCVITCAYLDIYAGVLSRLARVATSSFREKLGTSVIGRFSDEHCGRDTFQHPTVKLYAAITLTTRTYTYTN
jgi:hypothetical protein